MTKQNAVSVGAGSSIQTMAPWSAKFSVGQNRPSQWPGRLDPCNMSKSLDDVLQSLANQLVHHGLTEAQQVQAKEDLSMIAMRCMCQGRVGPGKGIQVVVQGRALELDGVDLTLLLQAIRGKPLTVVCLQNAAFLRQQSMQSPQAIELRNPSEAAHPVLAPQDGIDFQKMLALQNVRSPMYPEMQEIIRMAPVPPFDGQQKFLARTILDMLPPVAQGRLRDVPAELIGATEFIAVMRAAAHQKQLPAPLQKFRDSCLNNDAMKRAIYQDPQIAARVLGIPNAANPRQGTGQNLAHSIAQHVVESAGGDPNQQGGFSRFIQRVLTPGQSMGDQLAKKVFRGLQNYQGFSVQDMADVPACFNDIACPETSRVRTCAAGPLRVHANWVSLGDGRKAVAAMPPWQRDGVAHTEADFVKMMAGSGSSTVIDLRSSSDFDKGAHDYCPALGATRQLKDPSTGKTIAVKTLHVETLEGANCRALTLQVTVGDEPPRPVKVIQFRGWPDHGVISPAQLRQLRQMMGKELAAKQSVVTHCRAGVGRTGTLLAYEHLHHKLIEQGQGQAMVDACGKVDKKTLLTAIAEVVAQGRIERGPNFVQSQEQFLLLYQTLKEDLKTHTASPSQTVAAVDKSTAPYRAPKRVGLGLHAASNFCPEPVGTDEGLQHWLNILEQGEDVVEIISNPNRLFSGLQAQQQGAPVGKGLGLALGSLLGVGAVLQSDQQVGTVGPYQVTVKRLPAESGPRAGVLVQSQQVEIFYQRPGTGPAKRLVFTQMLTPYDGRKLTADQLQEGVKLLHEAGHVKPKWLSSVRGGGRPSALLVAQAMHIEIARGNIQHESQLIAALDGWIAQGRKVIWPLFINTQEQRQALIELGKRWMG